ncbi:FAD:protein FMN transferase [Polycladidibacter stylochi]|uniref:FAD:protein FMN transferase n=1 Tax=Polycladidibacter stylochi TaxID=1807766 RepID=UPI00082A9E85|nr:FAD:protein FMN transferase [Pseudovibrio stylochi]
MRKLIVIICFLVLVGCGQGSSNLEEITITGKTMGTTYHVKAIVGEKTASAQVLHREIEQTLKKVNQGLSNWVKDSEVENFNRSRSTEWTPISGDFSKVMSEALRIHRESSGYFDVTLAPLIDLWGFGPSKDTPPRPSDAAIQEALASVGMSSMLEYADNPPALRKVNPETTVNLSAIAKGFGIDKVAATLEANGFDNYMVEIGGDLFAKGHNAHKQDWVLGIEKPDAAAGSVQHIVHLSGKGMATSGDYRNYKEVNGKRASHILNAVTGMPIAHRLASVTVIAENATRADGLATAIFALGETKGMALAERLQLPVFMIIRDGAGFRQVGSPAFKAYEKAE